MKNSYNPENYWDEVAENISARDDIKLIAGDDEPYYRYKRKRFLELLDTLDFAGREILEIGSGPGGNLDYILSKGCKKITGVDISSQMIALANTFLKGKNVDVIKINGSQLPFPDNSFDIVFTSTVLQHNTNESVLHALVNEICRVSRDEVYLFERIENKIKGHETNLGRPVSYYQELMKQHGFQLSEKRGMPLQASYYTCGVIRKVFNSSKRKEGEPLTKTAVTLENLFLPLTRMLDKVVPSNRDVMLLKFRK